MKIKLLVLLGMSVVPLLSIGQTTKPCLFNKGKMSIVGTNSENTVLYVNGDFIVSRDADDANVKSQIYVDKSQTVITGDFIQDASYDATESANVFVLPDNYQSNRSSFLFRGTDVQNIKTGLGYNSLRKGANYINFPDIVVENSNTVVISPEIAAKAQNVVLTKGKLILDSRRLTASDEVSGSGTSATTAGSTVNDYSILAHLDVSPDGQIQYNRDNTITDLADYGVVQVRMALDVEGTNVDSDGKISQGRSVVGMGSPFEQLSSDYFMWNYLMFPYDNNIIGRLNYTETSPRLVISAGKGFVTGIDLKGTDAKNYTPGKDWVASMTNSAFAQRAKDGYVFDRFAYQNLNNIYPLSLQSSKNGEFQVIASTNVNATVDGLDPTVTYPKTKAYQPYIENLVYKDVSVQLIAGFNYLSNPYTAPLDVKSLLVQTAVADEWGVNHGSSATGYDVYNRVWVLNPSSKASATHNLSTGAAYAANQEKIYVSYSYLLMRNTGGTYSDESGNDYTIAPLQMFLVYANSGGVGKTFTIPAKNKKITQGSLFLRSTPTVNSDDFLFEVRDKQTDVFDRTAVVIRTPEQIKADPSSISIEKIVTTVSDGEDDPKNVGKAEYKTVTRSGIVSTSLHSLLYTKDDLGNALESNFLSALSGITEKTIALYLSPSQTKQEIAIRAGRLNTMDRVKQIFLEDKLMNKTFELSSGKEYLTQVSPTDAQDRFNLRFVFSTSNVDDEFGTPNQSIYSYYADNNLTVKGFEPEDMNSLISIYDIQGRLLNQAKVTSLEMNIPVSFASGAYIVKVLGKKSYVSKFLVK